MAYRVSDEPERGHGGEDSGRDSLNFVPEIHHTASVDSPAQGAGVKHDYAEEETTPRNTQAAREGAEWALETDFQGGNPPFTESSGMFSSGHDHAECFRKAIQSSGGVRQGDSWVSDPAPGVARVSVPHTITLEKLHKQYQGSGNTFETQRRSSWVKDKWG